MTANVSHWLLGSAGEEDELTSRAVWRVTEVEHQVPGGLEIGLDLVAVTEAQRRL